MDTQIADDEELQKYSKVGTWLNARPRFIAVVNCLNILAVEAKGHDLKSPELNHTCDREVSEPLSNNRYRC